MNPAKATAHSQMWHSLESGVKTLEFFTLSEQSPTCSPFHLAMLGGVFASTAFEWVHADIYLTYIGVIYNPCWDEEG